MVCFFVGLGAVESGSAFAYSAVALSLGYQESSRFSSPSLPDSLALLAAK